MYILREGRDMAADEKNINETAEKAESAPEDTTRSIGSILGSGAGKEPSEENAPSRGIMNSENLSNLLEGLLNLLDDGERELKNAEIDKIPEQTCTGKAIRPTVNIYYLGNKLKRGTDYTIAYSNNTEVGTGKAKITGKGRYKGTRTVSFKIVKKAGSTTSTGSSASASSAGTAAKKFTVSLGTESYVYNGKARKPGVKVSVGGKTVTSSNYTAKYTANKSVGNATVTVTGKGEYKNYKGEATFTITLKKTSFSSVKAGAEGEVKLAWNKDPQAEGYQIESCTRKDFDSGIKKAAVKTNTGTETLTGLSSGKKYYVRIRSYKKVGSKNWYSDWSTARVVTVK